MEKNPENAAREYFGRNAAHYATSPAHTEAETLGRLVELSRPLGDWRLLDIATGAGHTAFAFAPRVQEVVATDLTPEMLAQAQRLADERGIANISWKECDVHALPWPDARFDAVTCRRAAHHFGRLDVALAEMKRVLKPGGRLIIDDRSVPEDDLSDRLLNALDRLHDRSHVQEYRASTWEALLGAHGLQVEAVETYRRSRPIASYTTGALPEDQTEVHRLVAAYTEDEKTAVGYREEKGEIYLDHWYVILIALNTSA